MLSRQLKAAIIFILHILQGGILIKVWMQKWEFSNVISVRIEVSFKFLFKSEVYLRLVKV